MLRQPYPFLYNKRRSLQIAVFVSLFIFLINYLINEDQTVIQHFLVNRVTFSLTFGGITAFFIVLLLEVIPSVFFKEVLREQWTLRREAVLLGCLFALIILANYLFLLLSARDIHQVFQLKTFLVVVLQGVLIGFIPALIAVLINYMVFLKRNLKQVKIYNSQLLELTKSPVKEKSAEEISISTNNKNETIRFVISQLWFVKSEGNYVEVCTHNGESVQKGIYRIPMQMVEEALQGYPQVKRTHRCYLVNLQNVKTYKGNARNFQLFFTDEKVMVPVSRNKFPEIQEYMSAS